MKEVEELREKIKNRISQLTNDRDTEAANSTAFNPYGYNFAIDSLVDVLKEHSILTFKKLDDIIATSPEATVISTGEEVMCMTHDKHGVLCEDSTGVTVYLHEELTLI